MLPFPVIIGCTASGKSGLAMALARAAMDAPGALPPVEIVSADSMQVYRGMDIGTAKPSAAERAEAPHHLVDIREPGEAFSVEQWLTLAERTIADIRSRERLPVVVGGSLLYVKALLEGLFEGPPADDSLRAELRSMPSHERRAALERADPAAAARIHPNDERRTIRALEVHRATGRPISDWQEQWDADRARTDAIVVSIHRPTEALNRRINARVRAMADAGLVHEVWSLWRAGSLTTGSQSREALGYKQLVAAFEALASHERDTPPPPTEPRIVEALERTKIETRRFAKNQRTWLRRIETSVAPERLITVSSPDSDEPDLKPLIDRVSAAAKQE